jgi:hypothetical protein
MPCIKFRVKVFIILYSATGMSTTQLDTTGSVMSMVVRSLEKIT